MAHLAPKISFCAAYVYLNLSNVDLTLGPLSILISGIRTFGGFFSIGYEMKSIKAMYAEIQAIVDRTKETPFSKLYVKTERISNFYTK